MTNLIAVTIGDINGIGVHLLEEVWKKRKFRNFVLITNRKLFEDTKIFKNSQINIISNYKDIDKFNTNKINILNFKTRNKHTNVIDSLKLAYKLTKKKLFIGILTLPLNKLEINRFVSKNFIDQTTFFSNLENKKDSNMIFIYKSKFFVPLTIHVELKNVYKFFKNKNFILNKILSLKDTLKKDFNIKNPKMIIAGINPHAGENGLISLDEKKYIIPILNKLKNNKTLISGPVSGDGLINYTNLKKYDVFLFPYHDQALIPFKIISKFEGVNYTSNLNIIRLSPSHGTARDIIGKNIASINGLINCFKIIKKIHQRRKF